MKAKQIFKKVEEYNKLSSEFGKSCNLYVSFEEDDRLIDRFNSYKEFSKFIKNEIIKEVANQILNDDWQMIDGREYSLINVFDGSISNYKLFIFDR